MSKVSESDAVVAAINRLHCMRHVLIDEHVVELVLLVHPDCWRPIHAEWWSGKEASIIGADVSGNFLLRRSDGSVAYWNHEQMMTTVVAPSVRDFVASIR